MYCTCRSATYSVLSDLQLVVCCTLGSFPELDALTTIIITSRGGTGKGTDLISLFEMADPYRAVTSLWGDFLGCIY